MSLNPLQLHQTRSGGAYIPPARLALLKQAIQDKEGEAWQRMQWEATKKTINGLVNKANTTNIKNIVVELFRENLLQGRGLLVRSLIKTQHASLPFTPVYAALIAVLNTKLPQLGALLVNRIVSAFRKAFKRNDKAGCQATTLFIAHLTNQQVAQHLLCLQIISLLLTNPTSDSIEIAVTLTKNVGMFLSENPETKPAMAAIFQMFTNVLHEGTVDKRVQYAIEVLFEVRKTGFKDYPSIPEGLDIIQEEDQNTHWVSLDDELEIEESSNVFRFDPEYAINEAKYKEIKEEILDEDSDEHSEEEEEDGDDEEAENQLEATHRNMEIEDQTGTDLVNLRRTIYLTIMSSLSYEESAHKLMGMMLREGQEQELTNMIVECGGQEKTYDKYYGSLAETFCKMNRVWTETYLESFATIYLTIHRFETNRIRNLAKLFAHLLYSESLPWPQVLSQIMITEEDTTSSSRIFCKIMFQDLAESLGLQNLYSKMQECGSAIDGLFVKRSPKDARFSVNYWTSIGLGGLTDDLREWIKELPKAQITGGDRDSDDSSDVSSSETESDSDISSLSSSSSDTSMRRSPERRSRRHAHNKESYRSPKAERNGHHLSEHLSDNRRPSTASRTHERHTRHSPDDRRPGDRHPKPKDRYSNLPKADGIYSRDDRSRPSLRRSPRMQERVNETRINENNNHLSSGAPRSPQVKHEWSPTRGRIIPQSSSSGRTPSPRDRRRPRKDTPSPPPARSRQPVHLSPDARRHHTPPRHYQLSPREKRRRSYSRSPPRRNSPPPPRRSIDTGPLPERRRRHSASSADSFGRTRPPAKR